MTRTIGSSFVFLFFISVIKRAVDKAKNARRW